MALDDAPSAHSEALTNQVHLLLRWIANGVDGMAQNSTEAEVNTFIKDEVPTIAGKMVQWLTDKYIGAQADVEKDVKVMKKFYRSQKDMPGKKNADILKEIWAELPKVSNKPVPPLDEEMLAELAEEPAIIEGEFKHSWGTADKLYKSEAIDAFGMKHLLGVFETKDEQQKACADWNAEYEQARADMKVEIQEWSKQENARLYKGPSGRERIKKVLEEARR